jgi:hypothetical protein
MAQCLDEILSTVPGIAATGVGNDWLALEIQQFPEPYETPDAEEQGGDMGRSFPGDSR